MAYATLRSFLDDPRRPLEALNYHEAQGFLFTIVSAPQHIEIEEWLPQVLGENEFNSPEDVVEELLSLFEDICNQVADEPVRLPEDCAFREDVLANLEEDAPVSAWSRGFIAGHRWLEELWEPVPDGLNDEYVSILPALSFFASPRVAEIFVAEAEVPDLRAFAEVIRDSFEDAMTDYVRLATAIEMGAHMPAQPVRVEKVPRNAPCPCGSGRKYKKCCGA